MRFVRWAVLALALAATAGCGAPDATPAPAPQTAIVLTIDFSANDVDTFHVTGVALTRGRDFGPYDVTGREVHYGAAIGLVFDPLDDGMAMVCVDAQASGALAANACGTFAVRANRVETDTLALVSAPPPPPPPGDCDQLAQCCTALTNGPD